MRDDDEQRPLEDGEPGSEAEADEADAAEMAEEERERRERARRNHPQLSRDDRRKRLQLVESLLVQGASQSTIDRQLRAQFGTGRKYSAFLCDKVRSAWAEEERARRPYYKAAQIRRVLQEIASAKATKVDPANGSVVHRPNWGAVAQLENLLADLTGAREPLEMRLDVDVRTSEALLHVIGTMTPDRIRALAMRQRQLRALASGVVGDDEPLVVLPSQEP
jgi:hypothetical protein